MVFHKEPMALRARVNRLTGNLSIRIPYAVNYPTLKSNTSIVSHYHEVLTTYILLKNINGQLYTALTEYDKLLCDVEKTLNEIKQIIKEELNHE